jgi:hypothetical protein
MFQQYAQHASSAGMLLSFVLRICSKGWQLMLTKPEQHGNNTQLCTTVCGCVLNKANNVQSAHMLSQRMTWPLMAETLLGAGSTCRPRKQ